ncbi:MAG TPA: hypothetical protein VOB72_23640 [Candidatus Dormibacteraeota bacterium]|nr:hypothetical protein [Candidatus Dormibacteraeota bacterium]
MTSWQPQPRPHLLAPVLLIGAGVVALLVTTGLVGGGAAGRLLALWPLLLVLLGVQIVVLDQLPGRRAALVALVAMLAVVALGAGLALAAPGARVTTYHPSAPLVGAVAGSLKLDAGPGAARLAGRDLGDDLYQADISSVAGRTPTAEVAGGSVHLAPHPSADVLWVDRAASRDLGVTLTSRVPWSVTVNGAGLDGKADLSALDVSAVTLNGAFMTFDLRLPAAPAGAVPITVNGVGADVIVRVPPGVGARAVVAGLATGLDVNGTAVGRDAWSSPGFDGAAGHYEIRAAGVGSHVRVETMP